MRLNIFLIIFNVLALLAAYAIGNGWLIIGCIASTIAAFMALIFESDRRRNAR